MTEYAKCVGCGYCCIKTKCPAALRLYPNSKQCPQLIWNDEDNRYYCGLMLLPGELGRLYRKELHAGTGCSSSLFNSWRKDIKRRDKKDVEKLELVSPIDPKFQVFLRCLGSQIMSSDLIKLTVMTFVSDLTKMGYEESYAKFVGDNVLLYIKNNRHSFLKSFIG
jgi:hypothetical protein